MKKTLLATALSCLLLAGCGESPFNSLESPEPSEKYTAQFWIQEHQQNTQLWQEALARCKAMPDEKTPGCQAVVGIAWLDFVGEAKPVPEYKDAGFGADDLPTFVKPDLD